MQARSHEVSGITAAITTPFVEDGVSPEALERNVTAYLRTGLDGFLVLGSTGEAVLVDDSERPALLDTARRAIPSDRRLVVGVDAGSTSGAIRQVREAGAAGADAVLLSTPHYYREAMTHTALLAHFTRIADASPVPVLLYDVPKFTAFELPDETVIEASRHGNIAGLKDSSGDLAKLQRLRPQVSAGFRLECGSSRLLVAALEQGADGAMLALAAVLPEPLVAIGQHFRAGRRDLARELHAKLMLVAGLLDPHGVAGIKAALDERGLYGGSPRSPLLSVLPEVRAAINSALEAARRADLIREIAMPGVGGSTSTPWPG